MSNESPVGRRVGSPKNLLTLIGLATLSLGAGLAVFALLGLYSRPPSGPLPLAGLAPVVYERPEDTSLGGPALSLISYDWETQLPGWRIHFVPGDGPVAGYTWSQERLIEVFVREGDTPESLARVIAHELGHAIDVTMNSAEERRLWLQMRSSGDVTWWPESGKADFQSGAGDFAESVAFWLIEDMEFRSQVAPEPTPDQLRTISEMAAG